MTGMTVIVIKVDKSNPPISAMAIGVKKELFAKIKGINPKIVVTELRSIGLIRLFTEDLQASKTPMPVCFALSIYSIRRIPLFTTTPIRLAVPKPTVKVKFVLVMMSAEMIPIIARSTVAMTIRGLISELN